jgi:hypothetical protein
MDLLACIELIEKVNDPPWSPLEIPVDSLARREGCAWVPLAHWSSH